MFPNIILLFSILALSSCSSVKDMPNDNSDLTGTWIWVSTDGGFNNHIHDTPSSTGKNRELILKSSEYLLFENGTEISAGTYQITVKRSIYSGQNEPFISFSNYSENQIFLINGIITHSEESVLSISDNNPDGIGLTFEKVE